MTTIKVRKAGSSVITEVEVPARTKRKTQCRSSTVFGVGTPEQRDGLVLAAKNLGLDINALGIGTRQHSTNTKRRGKTNVKHL